MHIAYISFFLSYFAQKWEMTRKIDKNAFYYHLTSIQSPIMPSDISFIIIGFETNSFTLKFVIFATMISKKARDVVLRTKPSLLSKQNFRYQEDDNVTLISFAASKNWYQTFCFHSFRYSSISFGGDISVQSEKIVVVCYNMGKLQ